jgi:anhydro-N-acetylmuramic acid kinase
MRRAGDFRVAELFVGLMSGSSLDGVDAVVVDFSRAPGRLVASRFAPYPEPVRGEALALNSPGRDELARAALLANALSELYATAVRELLAAADIDRTLVAAIGCHGQTVRHRPDLGYTVQLVNGALLAELAELTVVCDFRNRDVAAGGQGAPLVPAFHAACFAAAERRRVIANIGGIANITCLHPGEPLRGFDTGPGNVLLDLWAARHRGEPFDRDGVWAASGKVVDELLRGMLAEPFFGLPPPKSTGRDLFNAAWLARFSRERYAPADVQATLAALTATSIADAVEQSGGAEEVFVCGGGASNAHLMRTLAAALPGVRVTSTAAVGVDPDWVEAMAFAWLAREALAGRHGNVPEVTGATGPRVLGAIYPA